MPGGSRGALPLLLALGACASGADDARNHDVAEARAGSFTISDTSVRQGPFEAIAVSTLAAGAHELVIAYTPLDANMNRSENTALLDAVRLTFVTSAAALPPRRPQPSAQPVPSEGLLGER